MSESHLVAALNVIGGFLRLTIVYTLWIVRLADTNIDRCPVAYKLFVNKKVTYFLPTVSALTYK